MIEDINARIKKLTDKIQEFKDILNIEEKRKKMCTLQMKMAEPHFWDDQKSSSAVINELKALKEDVESFQEVEDKINELKDLVALGDSSYCKDIVNELERVEKETKKVSLKVLFQGKFDASNAILEINSGAGGTEACDWAHMLFRMYFRWAEEKKYKVKVLNELRGEEAGIKSITMVVEGYRAYGLLKAEKGVHRLVRISPFDANKRRHTSFASVEALPEIKGEIEVEIKPEELRIDTFRASGAGGQHVNRTDSAVRITHLPTGIVIACQNERSQHQNKHTALNILKAKLYQRKEEEQKREREKLSGNKMKIEWGSQIRSYILHPYLLVKDHRTGYEVPQAKDVLDGKIDEFIYSFLKKRLEDDKKNSPQSESEKN